MSYVAANTTTRYPFHPMHDHRLAMTNGKTRNDPIDLTIQATAMSDTCPSDTRSYHHYDDKKSNHLTNHSSSFYNPLSFIPNGNDMIQVSPIASTNDNRKETLLHYNDYKETDSETIHAAMILMRTKHNHPSNEHKKQSRQSRVITSTKPRLETHKTPNNVTVITSNEAPSLPPIIPIDTRSDNLHDNIKSSTILIPRVTGRLTSLESSNLDYVSTVTPQGSFDNNIINHPTLTSTANKNDMLTLSSLGGDEVDRSLTATTKRRKVSLVPQPPLELFRGRSHDPDSVRPPLNVVSSANQGMYENSDSLYNHCRKVKTVPKSSSSSSSTCSSTSTESPSSIPIHRLLLPKFVSSRKRSEYIHQD